MDMDIIRMERIHRAASTTSNAMLDNALRTNTSLHKAQRKEDKDKTATPQAPPTSSKGVGINAGSVGNEDNMSNTGDMRGSGSSEWGESFSSEEEDGRNEDAQELQKSLDFFKKDKVYHMKVQHTEEDQLEEEKLDINREEDYEWENDDTDNTTDRASEEKVILPEEEKDVTYKEPEHRVKDKYTSEDEKKAEEKKKEEPAEIVLPQIKIQSSGLTMDIPDEPSPDIVETGNTPEDMFFDKPSLYRLEDVEQKEVPEDIKKSPEYMKEQNNCQRILNMLVHCSSSDIAGRLIERLYQLGDKILDTCLAFDVKIVVMGAGEKLSNIVRNTEHIGDLRAGYSENLKICFLGEEWLYEHFENLYRFNTPVYLMAIAFDHATGGDSFASLKSPFVLNNYHACRRGEEGHQYMEGIAAYSPVEYFAQTLETFLQGKDNTVGIDLSQKVFEGKISTNDELYYTDLSMHQYIDYLVKS
jgi:hypothetical protein